MFLNYKGIQSIFVTLLIIFFTIFLFFGKVFITIFILGNLFPNSIKINSNLSLSIYSLLILSFFIVLIVIGFILEITLKVFIKNVKDIYFLDVIFSISLFGIYLFIIDNIIPGIETTLLGKAYIGSVLLLIFMVIAALQKKFDF
ncbi:MAG: hypothetical protein ACQEV7_11390 [Bacillota bacterium]